MALDAENPKFCSWQARDSGETECSSSPNPQTWKLRDGLVQVRRLERSVSQFKAVRQKVFPLIQPFCSIHLFSWLVEAH